MKRKVGVYVCHCGSNIAGYLDVKKAAEFAAKLPSVAVAHDYTFMCSDPGQDLIKSDIKELGLNGVLVCSCSPTLHLNTFRNACASAGLNPHLCEMATIREQCSWVHSHDNKAATEKAMSLIADGVQRVLHRNPLDTKWAPVTPNTLIVGAGIAGIQAALEIACTGEKVYLVEKKPFIGGRMAQLGMTLPNLDSSLDTLTPRMEMVAASKNIELFTNSEVEEVAGYIGNFKVKIKSKHKTTEVKVGACIIATGADTFDPTPIVQLGYGKLDNVLTSPEFERMLAADGPTGGKIIMKNGAAPKSVAIAHCIGSRDQNYHPYCSRICCMYSLKYARLIKQQLGADTNVYELYIDMRCFGKGHEEFYKQASDDGVIFIRGKIGEVSDVPHNDEEKDKLVVVAEDTLLDSIIRIPVDMVILSVAMQPRADMEEVARTFLLGRSSDGFFLERHPKLDPVGTMLDGIFSVGCCQGPKDIGDTVAQATGAAARALALISKGRVQMEAATAVVNEDTCSGCGVCTLTCQYNAVEVDPRLKLAKVNENICKGCGACAVTCPSKSMQLKNFTQKELIDVIDEATKEYSGMAGI